MNAIAKLKDKLSQYQNLKYEEDSFRISVPKIKDDGFCVDLIEEGNELVVYFEGWHEHFDNEFDAFNCFLWGLSLNSRLKVLSRGTFDYKWILEMKMNELWSNQGTTGLIFFPFWKEKRERILKNDHINLEKRDLKK